MKNSDMPAMPQSGAVGPAGDMYKSEDFGGEGLTKRERFCLHMGVAESGDEVLDAIIRKGNHQKIATMAMQGMCANKDYVTKDWKDIVVKESAYIADALLSELAKGEG